MAKKKKKEKEVTSGEPDVIKAYLQLRETIINIDPEIRKAGTNKVRAAARRGRKGLQEIIAICKQLRKDLVTITKKK